MSTRDEQPDLAALCAGDPDAWELIYRQVYPRLFAYARHRVPSDHVAEDAVSETMMRAMNRIEHYRPGAAGVAGWLFGICRLVLLEGHRARARQLPVEPADLVDMTVETAPEPSARIEADEECQAVRRAFSRLPEADREVLELRVVLGLDAHEAGALSGRRAGAVRTAQSRALARLRVEMKGLAT